MKILVTNDDGWGAAGINTLIRVAQSLGDVWVVAPEGPMSGISHQMTFEVPMGFVERENQSFSLSGTPADCVRVAVSQLGVTFDWVLSGINQGANLGVDVYISGTVAAAREATYYGCKAIALSQYLQGFRPDFEWEHAEALASKLLPELMSRDLKSGEFFNVNFPDTLGESISTVESVYTSINRNPLPTRYDSIGESQIMYCGKYRDRGRQDGSDVDVCFNGNTSVTRHFPQG